MKNLKNIFFLAGLIGLFASCESDDEKASGSPVGNQDIVTIDAVISSNASTTAFTNQKVPLTVDLLGKTFIDTVVVEVTTLNKSGSRTRKSFDILPGRAVVSDTINAAGASGGATYNTTFDMFVSGISLKTSEPGKHYLIKSNVLSFNTGNLSVPSDNSSKLQIRFAWLNPGASRNNLKVFVDRPNVKSFSSAFISNSGTNFTVQSTEGLEAGMALSVSSGLGEFPTNTIVTAVTGATNFTASAAPTNANRLRPGSIVNAGGNDAVVTGANSVIQTNPTTGLPTVTNLVDVPSTVGLYQNMVVYLKSGAGLLRVSTSIAAIVSPTQIRLSLAPITLPQTASNPLVNALVNAELVFAFAEAYPTLAAAVIHDINVNPGTNSNPTSTIEGDYDFKLIPTSLLAPGVDLPYRILWKYPNGKVEFYEGIFPAITVDSPSKTILKVTKIGNGSNTVFTVTPQ